MIPALNFTVPIKLILVTLIFIILDVIVGIVKAVSQTGFKSIRMREGLYHKLGEVMCIAFGVICEMCFPIIGISISIPIVSSICIYIALMETASIVENLAVISPSISKMLTKVFGEYKAEDE